MKRWIALLVVVLAVFAWVERDRLFVRDVLGSVTRDGVKEAGAQVYVNYKGDVLLENDNPPLRVTLVQRGQPIGLPSELKGLHWLMYLTDAYPATLVEPDPGARIESMSASEVCFHDYSSREAVVKLY